MKAILFFLPLAGIVAPGLAGAVHASDASLENWFPEARDLEMGRAYLVSDNITVDPWEELDPATPGVTLLGPPSPSLGPEEGMPLEEDEELIQSGHAIVARQNGKARTQPYLGRQAIDWGCETSVRTNVRRAVENLCRSGKCFSGERYVVEVKAGLRKGNLVFQAFGNYNGNVRHRLIQALQELSVPGTHKGYKYQWTEQIGKGGQAIMSCPMTRFANNLAVIRRDPKSGAPVNDIEIVVTPPKKGDQGFCGAKGTLTAIADAISGKAAGWFGVVADVICEQ